MGRRYCVFWSHFYWFFETHNCNPMDLPSLIPQVMFQMWVVYSLWWLQTSADQDNPSKHPKWVHCSCRLLNNNNFLYIHSCFFSLLQVLIYTYNTIFMSVLVLRQRANTHITNIQSQKGPGRTKLVLIGLEMSYILET